MPATPRPTRRDSVWPVPQLAMRSAPSSAPARAAAVLAALLWLLAAAAGPAAAVEDGVPPGEGADAGRESCVVVAEPDAHDRSSATRARVSCFATFAAAVDHATAGAVRLPADATTVTDEQLAAQDNGRDTPRASTILGIEYRDGMFSGPSLVLTWPGAVGCGSGSVFGFPSMGALGWSDRISSARAYAGCRSAHYQDASFRGGMQMCTCAVMTALNDRTSSIRFQR
jgi:hypothetical protein